MTALALERPGPGTAGARDAFLASAHAAAPGTPRPLLYEDDVVRAIAEVTGMPISEADDMRADLVHRGGDPVADRSSRARPVRGCRPQDGPPGTDLAPAKRTHTPSAGGAPWRSPGSVTSTVSSSRPARQDDPSCSTSARPPCEGDVLSWMLRCGRTAGSWSW